MKETRKLPNRVERINANSFTFSEGERPRDLFTFSQTFAYNHGEHVGVQPYKHRRFGLDGRGGRRERDVWKTTNEVAHRQTISTAKSFGPSPVLVLPP